MTNPATRDAVAATVSLLIDGQHVLCPAGWTIYQAATSAGIHIPIFCHHTKLVPVGACRTCMVEIEGTRGLQTSCTTPVREGMVVRVHTSPAAVKQRKAVLEFLLTNHPLDCPVCDKGGECPLQDQAVADGTGKSRYVEPKRHKNKRYPLSELIVLDQERCVLCWRCIRFLDEWAGEHELDLFGRGTSTRVDTFPKRALASKWQGNTIDVCPVGALTSRLFRFEARVWELTNTPSICPLCPVGCNVVLGVKNNELLRVTPRENMQVNDTWICDKGRFAHGYVDHPDRLKTPLIRREGKLQPATWNEALDLVARRFGQSLQECGPQAMAALGSTRATNEANYLLQRFMRTVAGNHNIDHLGRFPTGATPLSSLPGLEYNDVILLLDFDPSTEAPLVELWIGRAAQRHGARVIAAHPRRIELSRSTGLWLSYRPGGEIGLLNGLAQAILNLGAGGKSPRITNADDYRSWLREYSPEAVQRSTGVPAEALVLAAQLLAQAERPIVLFGQGWVRSADASLRNSGAESQHVGPGQVAGPLSAHRADKPAGPRGHSLDCLANLAILLGSAEVACVSEDNNTLGALEMGAVPELFPGRQEFGDGNRSRLASLWGSRLSPVQGLSWDGMQQAAQEGSLRAMWAMGVDPASEGRAASEALGRIPFLVVQDLFMSATASTADVVLPAASFAETDGTYINLSGRLQAIHAARRPPGQARPDWWIVGALAKRMADRKQHAAWDLAPGNVLDEIAKVVPGLRGVSSAAIGETGWQPPGSSRLPGLPSATRRTFVRAEPGQAAVDAEYPFTLVTGRLLYDRGTLLSRAERLRALVPAPFVVLHPADAAGLDLRDGDEVWVASELERLSFILRVSSEVTPGVVFAPSNLAAVPISVLSTDGCLPRVRITK